MRTRMKKLLCFLCLLSCGMLHAQKTILRPPSIAKATESIEIAAVHLSDTATVIDIAARYIPKYWIRIDPATCLVADNGERYQIRDGIGIELGQEFWMPESGEASFSLIFPPLPKSVKSIDFVEGEEEGCFNLFGISLTGKLPKLRLPEGVKKPKKGGSAVLPTPEVKEGTAVISGCILDYKPAYGLKTELHSTDVFAPYGQRSTEVKPDEAGNFRVEVPVSHPSVAYLNVGGVPVSFLLAAGEEIRMYVNLREVTRASSRLRRKAKPEGEKVYFQGLNAGLNGEMNAAPPIPLCSVKPEELYDMTPEQYKAHCLKKYEEADQAIRANKKISAAYADLLMWQNKGELYELLLRCDYQLLQAYAKQKGQSLREASKTYRSPVPADDYFDFLSKLDYINSPRSLYDPNFLSNVRGTGYVHLPAARSGKMDMDANRKAVQAMIGEGGIYSEVLAAMRYAEKLENFMPLTEADFAALRAMKNPHYLNRLTVMNEALLRRIEENKQKRGFKVHALPADVANDALFETMVAPFKGKVVLVDFWATWCGPCKMGMKLMKPMKEELMDKDIVYVFIAGENSPEAVWNNMIPDIHGEHYRLTNEQWAFVCKQFEVRGVPTYLILDREGKQTYRKVGFPGAGAIKAELLKALDASAK